MIEEATEIAAQSAVVRAEQTGGHVSFIATKPIQIITSMILSTQFAPRHAELCVVPLFADAVGFLQRIGNDCSPFDRVVKAPNRAAAVITQALHGSDLILLDSDVGVKTTTALWLARRLRPRVRFALFEEGNFLFEPPKAPSSRLHRLLGATSGLGEGRFTGAVWTYEPDVLRVRMPNTPVRRIEISVAEFVSQQRDRLTRMFWPTYADDARRWRGTHCTLYLTSWEVDERAVRYLESASAFRVLKLHPHLRLDTVPDSKAIDQRIPAGVPAELVVLALSEVFDHVEVLHDWSTTVRYIKGKEACFVDVSDIVTSQ